MSSPDSFGSDDLSRYLPSKVDFGLDLRGIDAQLPAGGDTQEPVQPRLGGDAAAQLTAFEVAQFVTAVDHFS